MEVHVNKIVDIHKDPRDLKEKQIQEKRDLFWSIKNYQPTQEQGNSVECVSLRAFLTTSIQVPIINTLEDRGHMSLKPATGLSINPENSPA